MFGNEMFKKIISNIQSQMKTQYTLLFHMNKQINSLVPSKHFGF